jgi:hypothetical protein
MLVSSHYLQCIYSDLYWYVVSHFNEYVSGPLNRYTNDKLVKLNKFYLKNSTIHYTK